MITVNGKDYDPATFTPQIKAAIVQLDSCRQDKELLAVKLGVMAAAERALVSEIAAAVNPAERSGRTSRKLGIYSRKLLINAGIIFLIYGAKPCQSSLGHCTHNTLVYSESLGLCQVNSCPSIVTQINDLTPQYACLFGPL